MKIIILCINRCNLSIIKLVPLKSKLFFLLLTFTFVSITDSIAQGSRVWDYPIHYGTPEYEKLTTFEEQLLAYNIPDSILLNMTTKDLVKTCLNYPSWILITSRDDNQKGYKYIRSFFNGFSDLEQRPNACAELLTIYQDMNPDKILKFNSLYDQGDFNFKFILIEILLSQRPILANINNDELTRLIKTTLFVYEKKKNLRNEYSLYSISTTCLVLARILEEQKITSFERIINEDPEVQIFLDTGLVSNRELLEQITAMAEEYLKQI